MPDPQELTRRQIRRMESLADDHERPPRRDSSPRGRRSDGKASRVQPKRARWRTAGIQMAQSYLQVHD
jgi:hypothetical protein